MSQAYILAREISNIYQSCIYGINRDIIEMSHLRTNYAKLNEFCLRSHNRLREKLTKPLLKNTFNANFDIIYPIFSIADVERDWCEQLSPQSGNVNNSNAKTQARLVIIPIDSLFTFSSGTGGFGSLFLYQELTSSPQDSQDGVWRNIFCMIESLGDVRETLYCESGRMWRMNEGNKKLLKVDHRPTLSTSILSCNKNALQSKNAEILHKAKSFSISTSVVADIRRLSNGMIHGIIYENVPYIFAIVAVIVADCLGFEHSVKNFSDEKININLPALSAFQQRQQSGSTMPSDINSIGSSVNLIITPEGVVI